MHDSIRSHKKSESGVAGLIGVALTVAFLAIALLSWTEGWRSRHARS